MSPWLAAPHPILEKTRLASLLARAPHAPSRPPCMALEQRCVALQHIGSLKPRPPVLLAHQLPESVSASAAAACWAPLWSAGCVVDPGMYAVGALNSMVELLLGLKAA